MQIPPRYWRLLLQAWSIDSNPFLFSSILKWVCTWVTSAEIEDKKRPLAAGPASQWPFMPVAAIGCGCYFIVSAACFSALAASLAPLTDGLSD
jgi:hypothetical protein